ncbi:MAG: gamma-butyrobetaine hydroxylase-like domain-containing protein [Pseudomonadota bacterium]
MTASVAIPREIRLHRKSCLLDLEYADGTVDTLSAEYLRVYSPSAEVQGHGPGQRTLQHGKKDVRILGLEPQGNYALKIIFSDGHDSGLYSWAYLHTLAVEFETRWADYLAELEQAGKTRQSQFIAVSTD